MRTIQELLGHADSKTTQIYSYYAPSEHEVKRVDAAFAPEPAEEPEQPGGLAGDEASAAVSNG
jgi:creatinine amidohydrolase/Fe(II)-dependent formamide hydrolase-like protein